MTGDELGSYGTKATPQSTKPQLLPPLTFFVNNKTKHMQLIGSGVDVAKKF